MGVYIILSNLTTEGRKTIKKSPKRILEVNEELQRMGIKVYDQYALLGQYDFLSIIEADDPEQVMKMTVELGSRGTVSMTSLAAVPLETFIKHI